MSPDAGPGGRAGEVQIFRHTAATRGRSTAAAAVTAAALLYLCCGPARVPAPAFVVLGLFLVVSAWLSIANWGDRIELDGEGLRVRNAVWRALGLERESSVRWEEVAELREPRRRTLFLLRREGRPVVLDAVERYEALRLEVQARTGLPLP